MVTKPLVLQIVQRWGLTPPRVFSQPPHLKEIVSHPEKVPWPKLPNGKADNKGL